MTWFGPANRAYSPPLVVPGAPDKVQDVFAYASGDPGSAYVTHSMPAGNGAPVDSFRAVCSDGTTSNITSAYTTPVSALSCRENFHGLVAGSKTFQVQAHNAVGWGPLSDPTPNSVTVAATTGTFSGSAAVFKACGNDGIVGLSSRWGDNYAEANYRYVVPGTLTIDGSNLPAPAYPAGAGMTNQKVIEITGGASALQLHAFNDNPAGSSNGEIDLNDYNFWCFAFQVVSAAQRIFIPQLEFTFSVEGVVSAIAGNVITFANQTFGVNTWTTGSANGNSACFNRRNGAAVSIVSNTANTVTLSDASNFAIGDHVYMHTADQRLGNAFGPGFGPAFEPFIVSPAVGMMTLNAWNFAKIPLDGTGLNIRSIANGFLYKDHMGVPSGNGPWWCCLNGFCK